MGGGGGEIKLVCGRPTLALGPALVHQTKKLRITKNQNAQQKNIEKSKNNQDKCFSYKLVLSSKVAAFVGRFCGCDCFGWVDTFFLMIRLA